MGYASLRECVDDLERTGRLGRVESEVDPRLEAAEIQRRVYAAGGPALYFARTKGSRFPMVSNLFGTLERAEWIFRDTLAGVRALVAAKVDPADLVRSPRLAAKLPAAALHLLPRWVSSGPVLARAARVSELPQLISWPDDGGPFLTLPEVHTEDPDAPGFARSNLGMYRVQLAGNDYVPDREVGLHYQLHRGIGVHHAAAVRRKERLRVNVYVGGPPSFAVAAVMPLPEGLPELAFAGALGGRSVRLVRMPIGPPVACDVDFCIRGWVEPGETKREGPFGDHLGYYSLQHEFPVLHVESVHHREDAVFPFTTVGRPPQEDTTFGQLVHELTAPLVPTVLPGVSAVHAVDAAGVHPLLFAVGSERYVPFAKERRPMEVLTQASAILGQGQMSLAKYLFIAAREDEPPSVKDVPAFLGHVLSRIDPERDLHFVCNTTMDTLDYSGTGLNAGSKVVVAGVGPPRRVLAREVPAALRLPDGLADPHVAMPGVLVLRGPRFSSPRASEELEALASALPVGGAFEGFPLVVVVDDAAFAARTVSNLLWVCFTRSNPAVDVHGAGAFVRHKAWGCRGAVVIDARTKPHHAPPLVEDPDVSRRVDALFAKDAALRRIRG
jgi:4-hydroxy-3-polyprenylbenzoate decarboxylase